jgi:hypothetical protein
MFLHSDNNIIRSHRAWLGGFPPQYLTNWDNLATNNPQAAAAEAMVRELLVRYGCSVEPNQDLHGKEQTPDFLCQRNESRFYVEVTCPDWSCYPDEPTPGARDPDILLPILFEACRKKARQCGGLDAPCLLAVCSHNRQVSMVFAHKPFLEDLLTGELSLSGRVDTQTGCPLGEFRNVTQWRSAAFAKPASAADDVSARRSLSGILVCGFGCIPPKVYGLLHFSPARQFDRPILPQVEFCQLRQRRASGELMTEWV